ELGGEQMAATEDVQRQVAVGVVVAVEEAALLVAVQGIVGGIQIEHDRLRRAPMRLQGQPHEQRLHRLAGVPGLVIAARPATQGDRAAVESSHTTASMHGSAIERILDTLLASSGRPPAQTEVFVAEALSLSRRPDAATQYEKGGLGGMVCLSGLLSGRSR